MRHDHMNIDTLDLFSTCQALLKNENSNSAKSFALQHQWQFSSRVLIFVYSIKSLPDAEDIDLMEIFSLSSSARLEF